ncbi:MAG TPA: tyrosine-type recombinase/integrase [Anaerolineales bacterium]|nr:tyrosine-type recombinase/integrase [Anaerolineales bacterium]
MTSIESALSTYLDSVKLSRSAHTARTYANALNTFRIVLPKHGIDPLNAPAANLPEDAIAWLIKYLKDLSPATERLYVQATAGFYEYVAAEKLADINLPRLRLLIRQRARRPGIRLPQFPAGDIQKLLSAAQDPYFVQASDDAERLRAFRDRAFLLVLADTGLRVHEACKLRRGDVDFNEGQAMIVGKGDKQDLVRFSNRSMRAIRDYLAARQALDGNSGKPLTSLPLFARHDRGAGRAVKSITTETGRHIVHDRVEQTLGEGRGSRITPHSLRHYFVTTVLRASGNLKMAQELARHSNIQVTQRYAHLSNDELDRGYHDIFNNDDA